MTDIKYEIVRQSGTLPQIKSIWGKRFNLISCPLPARRASPKCRRALNLGEVNVTSE